MRILIILVAACSAFGQGSEERTKQALDQLLVHRFSAFYAMFSPQMKNAISLETFSGQMEQILALGAPRKIDEPRSVAVGGSTVIVIGVHWASVSLDFQVTWNKAGEIEGTYWRPEAERPVAWRSPSYVDTDSFTAIEITVGDDAWTLPGTLTMPKGGGPFPAVVLVHGSGPHDRDESVGGSKVFRDLAEGLSSRGIAVLRYVKRTKQYPSQCAADPDFTMNQETVEDAVRGAALVTREARIDPGRVFVLGHSQGGYMAPRIMKRNPKLAGFVVMAGNVRPLEELIVEQTEYIASLKGKLTADDESRLNAIRRNPFATFNVPAPYLADLKGYHPDSEAKQLDMPMLILQGERDYQVTMKDFALWKSALEGRQNVTFRSYPKLNHLFMAGDGKPSPAEYEQPGHVAEQVVGDIAKWVLR